MNSHYDADGFDVRKNSSDDIPPDDDYYDDGELIRFEDEEAEEWEYDLMNALDEIGDLAGGTVSLADFPTDPHYCQCCGGVIIETDFLYTGSLDRCYFCMGCDCMSARTPDQEAQWRKSREER